METTSILERLAPAKKLPATSPADYALNVVVVYQDQSTQTWAREVCHRVTHLVGENSIRTTWWNLHEFNQPAVLAAAVSQALRSDVIIVALRAAETLPLAFYVWVDTWLPHRPRESGALVALIGLSDQPDAQSDRARNYLRALSEHSHLDFLVQERKLPAPETDLATALVLPSDLERTRSVAAPSPRRAFRLPCRWRLNE